VTDLFDLSGRVAIVTGGAGLLGAEFASTLSEAGARVLVADIDAWLNRRLKVCRRGLAAVGCEVDGGEASVLRMADAPLEDGEDRRPGEQRALDPKFEGPSRMSSPRPLKICRPMSGIARCAESHRCPSLLPGGDPIHAPARVGVIINIGSTYGLVGPDQRIYGRRTGDGR
jgi:2-deoxy-D-gluconate 3-dehydrogenase